MELLRLSFLLVLALLVSACNEEPSSIPEITNLTVEPMLVEEFTDTVTISFDYYDYNGDLGHPDPNITSLSVKDSRLQFEDFYHVQPLAPVDANVPIQGRLSVRLNNLFILGNDSVEELQFEVMIQDRRGNWSELVESDTITVYRP
ncbi:MAG: hypothetical protein H6603_00710 [Flavobacteriales bacterium]|nr:hypothetical protein [Flavobacteriales bacterium]MCB9191122.1 hypothetical protein [Flavobacteriales bacterium]MCB9203468.1 hypothetical protein [Flavobacteriales bacterium]